MYHTVNIILKEKDKELKEYCNKHTANAKLFKNAVVFRLRQLYFARIHNYQNLSEHEKEILAEFETTYDRYPVICGTHMFPSYNQIDYMFKQTKNVDYYNELPMQCSQHIIKECLADFKSYLQAKKRYDKDPSKFTGKPKLPKYAKSNNISFDITNQDAVVYGSLLKLPKTKEKLELGNIVPENSRLKEVTIQPYYDTFKISIVFEIKQEKDEASYNKNNILGIDLGITNIISASNNCGLTPFIVKGNKIKSINQWYNKKLAQYKSELKKKENKDSSHRIQNLHMYRNNYTSDCYNKIASLVIKYCRDNNIGTVVIGKNDFWKQNVEKSKVFDQNFCFIAHSKIIEKITSIAERYNIQVILNEESYTSKASFLDNDFIPCYQEGVKCNQVFSGKRVQRGLYKTKEGILMNADINGASNIIRKAFPDAFDNVQDFSYLYKAVLTANI